MANTVIVRTFHKGKRIDIKYFKEKKLGNLYPSHFEVLEQYRKLISKKEDYYLDIDENGIHISKK